MNDLVLLRNKKIDSFYLFIYFCSVPLTIAGSDIFLLFLRILFSFVFQNTAFAREC